MAYEGTFTTKEEIKFKAGKDYPSISNEDDRLNELVKQAEARINNEVRFNFTEVYEELNENTKQTLNEVASNLVAQYIIIHDLSNYESRVQAEDMLQVLRVNYQDCINILRDQKTTTYFKRTK